MQLDDENPLVDDVVAGINGSEVKLVNVKSRDLAPHRQSASSKPRFPPMFTFDNNASSTSRLYAGLVL